MINCTISNSDNPVDQINDCLRIAESIDKESNTKVLKLDMSTVDWLTPFSALILSSKIVQSILRFEKIEIEAPKKGNVRTYMASIGFPLGKKEKGYSYSPIQHFDKDANKVANEIFDLIDQTFPDVLKGNVIKYILSEFCDNVEQHSAFTHASIMAQLYKNKNYVE